jgi:hypothetical protein
MLKEYPELGHCSTVNHLHKLINLHVLIALETFEWHMALHGKLFEHIRSLLMTLITSE